MSEPRRSPQPDDDSIRAWLRAHPELLIEQPELLAELVIPHATDATSLLERQIEVLRGENRKLERRLEHLTGIAGQNEQLMRRLHRLSLKLVTSASLGELVRQLGRELGEDFQADAVRLLCRPELVDANVDADKAADILRALPETLPEWLQALLEDGQPQCGRLTRSKRELLFGELAETIGSAALVPIGTTGLLAIGAQSDERFQPDMGTLFLGLLGEALAFRIDCEGAPATDRLARA